MRESAQARMLPLGGDIIIYKSRFVFGDCGEFLQLKLIAHAEIDQQ
jgi:hypothetical protein